MNLNNYISRTAGKIPQELAQRGKPKEQTGEEVQHGPGNNILGISLGLHSTVVARVSESGRPEILYNRAGQDITPSVVQFLQSGEIVVGDEAKKLLGTDTDNVFGEFLRDIGTDRKWVVNGLTVTPTDLTAILLRQVVKECSEHYGKPTAIALSWPANYRQDQRLAFIRAAEQAGIGVTRYISSPVAVALSHAVDNQIKGKCLIYDFGDRAFNVALLEARAGNLEVVFTGGVQLLGQRDLDAELLKIIANKFKEKTGGEFDIHDCNYRAANLRESMDSLSAHEKTTVFLVSSILGPIRLEITRAEFEAVISHLIDQTELACEGILLQTGIKHNDITTIIMTGIGSRVPALRSSTEKTFGRTPFLAHPEHAEALGAAVVAANALRKDVLTSLQQESLKALPGRVEITPHYAGVLVQDANGKTINLSLIAKGTRLPCSAIHEFQIRPGQTHLPISITESGIEETNPEFVSIIESTILEISPDTSRKIRIKLCYDLNALLSWSLLN